ncbi:MAG: DUF4430 domain-containing protein [Oscillospiraceae bacterium]|nr:DUF4430 domain-containing protein [Oscillospiraceae bacterium]
MNKKLLWAVIALVLVVAALVGVYFATRPDTQEGVKAFTLVVVHKDGSEKEFPIQSDEEYLGAALQKAGIIEGEQGQYGLYIQKVDGEKAVFEEDGAYWGFYVGDAYASLGIDQTPIEAGVTYKLVYTVDTGAY